MKQHPFIKSVSYKPPTIAEQLVTACQRLIIELEWCDENLKTPARKSTRTETIVEAKRIINTYQTKE